MNTYRVYLNGTQTFGLPAYIDIKADRACVGISSGQVNFYVGEVVVGSFDWNDITGYIDKAKLCE